jgi:hypothetical protein
LDERHKLMNTIIENIPELLHDIANDLTAPNPAAVP